MFCFLNFCIGIGELADKVFLKSPLCPRLGDLTSDGT
jgi:hypothetical protein